MKKIIKFLIVLFRCIWVFPIYIAVLLSREKIIILYEISIWKNVMYIEGNPCRFFLFSALMGREDYRSALYIRLGRIGRVLSHLYKGKPAFYCYTASQNIGKGLILHHPFSTIILCRGIGENCMIWQNVTIGRSQIENTLNCTPLIGNNVKICAGATLVGPITVGDNVTIAAGAVVVKNVPSNCLVGGNPARILKRNGIKTNESL